MGKKKNLLCCFHNNLKQIIYKLLSIRVWSPSSSKALNIVDKPLVVLLASFSSSGFCLLLFLGINLSIEKAYVNVNYILYT